MRREPTPLPDARVCAHAGSLQNWTNLLTADHILIQSAFRELFNMILEDYAVVGARCLSRRLIRKAVSKTSPGGGPH